MSSLLGRSDNNLRAVLGFAKRSPCCMLLDEIDAIAKRRSDDTDVGELKQNRQCDTRRLDTQGTPTAMYITELFVAAKRPSFRHLTTLAR